MRNLLVAAALASAALGLGPRIAQANIAQQWISTANASMAGKVHSVAIAPDGSAVYAAGTRDGLYWVGKFNALDGAVMWEYTSSTGYALGVGVSANGNQIAAIGGVITSTYPVIVSSYAIVLLDRINGRPVSAAFPLLTTGYYDLSGASTTSYRASIAFDSAGNLFAGWNESTTTLKLRKYAPSGAALVEFSTSAPSVQFQDLAVDTRAAGGAYMIAEADKIWIYQLSPSTLEPLKLVTRPWLGGHCCRRQSITVGPNEVIAGGQKLDLTDPLNPIEKTWWEKFSTSLATRWEKSETRDASIGGNRIYQIAQRQPLCGSMYAVGDSTSVWIGLFSHDGQFWTRTRDARAPLTPQGETLAADNNRTIYVGGGTRSGKIYVSRFDDNSCAVGPPPKPQPCSINSSAFPNPFKAGQDSVVIQFELLAGAVAYNPTVGLVIYGPTGGVVKNVGHNDLTYGRGAQRLNRWTWNGLLDQPVYAPAGTYEAVLTVTLPATGATCRQHLRIGIR